MVRRINDTGYFEEKNLLCLAHRILQTYRLEVRIYPPIRANCKVFPQIRQHREAMEYDTNSIHFFQHIAQRGFFSKPVKSVVKMCE